MYICMYISLSDAKQALPFHQVLPPREPSSVRYAALGDSITAGLCTHAGGYPESLAAYNDGWEAINLGAPGTR